MIPVPEGQQTCKVCGRPQNEIDSSQGRTLEEVEAMARKAIGLMLEVDPASFDVPLFVDRAAHERVVVNAEDAIDRMWVYEQD